MVVSVSMVVRFAAGFRMGVVIFLFIVVRVFMIVMRHINSP